jgi:general stress protein YciG
MRKNPFAKKNPNAVGLGRLGGLARAKSLSPEELSEISQKAGKARADSMTPEERREMAKMGGKASVNARKRKKSKE